MLFQFANYFKLPVQNRLIPAPVVQIDKRKEFTVRHFYLDDFNDRNVQIDYDNPSLTEPMCDLIAEMLVFRLPKIEQGYTSLPTILIFLPGILEINLLYKHLEQIMER